ncbi:hypothetical protein ACWGMW_19005 [Streptomyces albidoflavus]|nr:hypothetical protein [Streptomyces sp. B29(2018)]
MQQPRLRTQDALFRASCAHGVRLGLSPLHRRGRVGSPPAPSCS